MITAESFKTLKKANLTVDAEKSKTRISQAYKSADKHQKAEIRELTGIAVNSFYTGIASPKVVLSLSQVLGITPRYFTGEVNDKSPCDDAELSKLFKKYSGGKKKSASKKKADKVNAKDKRVVPNVTDNPKVADKPVKSEIAAKPINKSNISDDSLVKLFEALAIRAKYSNDAAATYEQVKQLLMR